MQSWFKLLFLFAAPALATGNLTTPQEFYDPNELEGLTPAQANSWDHDNYLKAHLSADTTLQIESLSRRGFIHQQRREAKLIENQPISLAEEARIYSSQALVAIRADARFLLLLYPNSSLKLQKDSKSWQFKLQEDRGFLRISTLNSAITLQFAATPRAPGWAGLELHLAPESDILIDRQALQIQSWLLRGAAQFRLPPEMNFKSMRAPGLLKDWQDAQIHPSNQNQPIIDLVAGQQLELQLGEVLSAKIALPVPSRWQKRLLKTSPQLAEASDLNQPSIAKVSELRAKIISTWLNDMPPNADNIQMLAQQQRWEEAFQLIMDLRKANPEAISDSLQSLEQICLYRLQQEHKPLDRRQTSALEDKNRPLLRLERIRYQLRNFAGQDIKAEAIDQLPSQSADSIYLLAIASQQQRQWRHASDYWEHWPHENPDILLQKSSAIWQSALDEHKPWLWQGWLALGLDSDNFSAMKGDAAKPDFHSSKVLRMTHQLQYLLERQSDFQLGLDLGLALQIYQAPAWSEFNRITPKLALDLSIHPGDSLSSYSLRPFFTKLMIHNQARMDTFGYEFHWHNPNISWHPSLMFSQEQNLALQQGLAITRDPLSGEATTTMDRSVRRNTLDFNLALPSIRSDFKVFAQTWDYRSDAAWQDNRLRFGLGFGVNSPVWQNMSLRGQILRHQDLFAADAKRNLELNSLYSLDFSFLGFYRWTPVLHSEQENQTATAPAFAWQARRVQIEVHGRW